jgi:hypothetical protein
MTYALDQIADDVLLTSLKRLTGTSNELTAQLLAHLAEVEARGIHRNMACASLYTYCVYELRMSEDEAQRRCRAARVCRQFPLLFDMLSDASIHLTGILLLAPHLTDALPSSQRARGGARFRASLHAAQDAPRQRSGPSGVSRAGAEPCGAGVCPDATQGAARCRSGPCSRTRLYWRGPWARALLMHQHGLSHGCVPLVITMQQRRE